MLSCYLRISNEKVYLLSYCRERGSHETADNLLAAAEKQWEAHLKTQALFDRRREPDPAPHTRAPEPVKQCDVKTSVGHNVSVTSGAVEVDTCDVTEAEDSPAEQVTCKSVERCQQQSGMFIVIY